MNVLEVKSVAKSYGGQNALGPLDLTFSAAHTTALIGPSGCGKSALLRVLIGLLTPDRGEVFVLNERLTPESARRLRHRMGYVVQDGGLFPHLSARDNVLLLPRHLGWKRERMLKAVDSLSDLVRLPAATLDRYPAELSGDQRQRVSLVRALMTDPEILLLDEPTGALDPMIRAELQSDLRALFAALRKTVVLVTHDLGEAAFLAHELVLMRDGAVVQRGDFNALQREPADGFVARFIKAQRWPEKEA